MVRRTETEIDIEEQTDTVEIERETIEQIERERDLLICDVCGREVLPDAIENDNREPKVPMYTLDRYETPPDEKDHEGTVYLDGSDALIGALTCYRPEQDTDRMARQFIDQDTGPGDTPQVPETPTSWMRALNIRVGLALAARLADDIVSPGVQTTSLSQALNGVQFLGVDLDKFDREDIAFEFDLSEVTDQVGFGAPADIGPDESKHVCGACWDVLFDG